MIQLNSRLIFKSVNVWYELTYQFTLRVISTPESNHKSQSKNIDAESDENKGFKISCVSNQDSSRSAGQDTWKDGEPHDSRSGFYWLIGGDNEESVEIITASAN